MWPIAFQIYGRLKKHLASKWFATDAEVKQAVNLRLQILTPFFYAGCLGAMLEQIIICQWWLTEDLMRAICYACAVHIGKSISNSRNDSVVTLFFKLHFSVYLVIQYFWSIHLHIGSIYSNFNANFRKTWSFFVLNLWEPCVLYIGRA